MSKPSKGLFRGTMGALKSGDHPEDIIAKRIAESDTPFDLREHPLQQSQLSAKQRKALRQKRDNRTMTQEEWKRMEWDRRFRRRRDAGVNEFWDQERERLASGKPGTRNWTSEQRRAILRGDKPKFDGITIQGHHTYSAAKYPHLANRGAIIYPTTRKEHRISWHNKNYKNSLPGRPYHHFREF